MDLQTVQSSSSSSQRPPTRQQQSQDKPDTNTLYEHITDDQAEVCVTSYTICLVWFIIAHLLIFTWVTGCFALLGKYTQNIIYLCWYEICLSMVWSFDAKLSIVLVDFCCRLKCQICST